MKNYFVATLIRTDKEMRNENDNSDLQLSTIGIEFKKTEKSIQTLKNIHKNNKASGSRKERNITNKYTDETVR